jgi:hypothetical protein
MISDTETNEVCTVIDRGLLMAAAIAFVLILAMSYQMGFMMLHGPYHIRMVDDAGMVSYQSSSALAFAEQEVDHLRQQYPTWQVSCLDCTPFTALISMAEVRRAQQALR